MGSRFCQTRFQTAELAALERLEKSPYTYNVRNVVNTLVPSLLRWILFISYSNRDNHKNLDEFEFRPDTIANTELAALERLKIDVLCDHSNSFICD